MRLIELRKTQALAEIRKVLADGIAELAQSNPTNFFRTTDQVLDNIQKAFDGHRKKIKQLTSICAGGGKL